MDSIYEILLAVADKSSNTSQSLGKNKLQILDSASKDLSSWFKSLTAYSKEMTCSCKGLKGEALNAEEFITLAFKSQGEYFRIFCPKDLVNLLASLVQKSEPLLVSQDPGEEELTIFSYLVVKLLSNAASKKSQRVYLSAILPKCDSSTVKTPLVELELQVEGETFSILLELTEQLDLYLSRIARFRLSQGAMNNLFFKEKIKHSLQIEKEIDSLHAISAMKEGSRISLGNSFKANFNCSYEKREVKVEVDSQMIEIKF